MPDAQGNFRGQGWSRARERAWDRVFGSPRKYCTNEITTPSDQRCWSGEEESRQAHTEPTISSGSTTKVGSSSPSSRERRGGS